MKQALAAEFRKFTIDLPALFEANPKWNAKVLPLLVHGEIEIECAAEYEVECGLAVQTLLGPV